MGSLGLARRGARRARGRRGPLGGAVDALQGEPRLRGADARAGASRAAQRRRQRRACPGPCRRDDAAGGQVAPSPCRQGTDARVRRRRGRSRPGPEARVCPRRFDRGSLHLRTPRAQEPRGVGNPAGGAVARYGRTVAGADRPADAVMDRAGRSGDRRSGEGDHCGQRGRHAGPRAAVGGIERNHRPLWRGEAGTRRDARCR